MIGKQFHFGENPKLFPWSDPSEIITVAESKPSEGLWTSTWKGPETAWPRWCADNLFRYRSDEQVKGWFVYPHESAKIFIVDSKEDWLHFLANYKNPESKDPVQRVFNSINWVKFTQDYHALSLTDRGFQQSRMITGEGEYYLSTSTYAWDMESTVWFAPVFDSSYYRSFSIDYFRSKE